MTAEMLWADPDSDRQILRSKTPSPETIAMLDATVWGSGSSRYRILGVAEKLGRLRDPSYFTLHEGGHEVSVIVLDYCWNGGGVRSVSFRDGLDCARAKKRGSGRRSS